MSCKMRNISQTFKGNESLAFKNSAENLNHIDLSSFGSLELNCKCERIKFLTKMIGEQLQLMAFHR
jgi:hypothetical protein